MNVLLILFYIVVTIGAVCSIINFVILASLGGLMARMSERLSELIDILFIVGNNKKERPLERPDRPVDRSVENLPGKGQGLAEVPGDPERYMKQSMATYDDRYSKPLQQSDAKQPIGPDGNPSNDGWETNL